MLASPSKRCDIVATIFLVLVTIFRFWYAGQHELVQDESYYWQWSRHLAPGYYDNTPAMAFVIRFFTAILGTNEIGVRAGAIVSALVASIFLYLLAKRILGPSVALVAVVVANIIPLFAAGAIIMTQDPVQLAFWSATIYVAWLAVAHSPGPAHAEEGSEKKLPLLAKERDGVRFWYWLLAGILAGLTAMSKLNGLLVLPSVFLYLCLAPSARRWLKHPAPYIAAMIALALFAPFVWWNHTHGDAFWIHIHAMGTRGDNGFTLQWLGEFLGAQAILISPLLFLTYLATLSRLGPHPSTPSPTFGRRGETSPPLPPSPPSRGEKEGLTPQPASGYPAPAEWRGPPETIGSAADTQGNKTSVPEGLSSDVARHFNAGSEGLYLWCASIVVFLVTVVLSLRSRVEGNWAVGAYISGMILVAGVIARQWPTRIGKIWHGLSIAVAILLTALVLFPNIGYAVGIQKIRALGINAGNDRTNELYGWREMAERVESVQNQLGGPGKCFVFGVNYRIPSELAFYLPGHPETYSLFLHDRANEYMFWEDERELVGKNAVFVNESAGPDHLADCRAVFAHVVVEPPVIIHRWPYKQPIRVIQIFACTDFKGYNPRQWQKGW